MNDLKIFEVERPWGNFRQFIENSPCTVKIITIKPNEKLSLQSHNKRAEFWYVVKGGGRVEIDEVVYEAGEGKEYEIKIGAKHRLTAGPYGLTVLEIALGEFDENGDITRYEDKYGRA